VPYAAGKRWKRNMYSVQISSLVIAAILSCCAAYAAIVPAGAGAITGSSEAAEAALNISPVAADKGGSSNTPAIFAATASPIAPPLATEPVAIAPGGRAYLFRGALGPIFSRGMDRLAERIKQAGVTASVNEFTICRFIAEEAIRDYRRDSAPITIIGHSMGGLCALQFAEMLQAENIPVSLVVTIDPAQISPPVPLNVERYINIFLSNSVLGSGDVVPEKGYHGHYASFNLSEHKDITHINIDKMNLIHKQLVNKIEQLATTPVKAEGEGVPIRYVVPTDAAIELWDSGIPVFARSGNTLETLAAYYAVPLWSLTQINHVSQGTPLTTGQRIVVPRHLFPLPAVFGHSPSGR
jgi:hypothetical protein